MARRSLSSLRFRNIDSVLTQNNHLLEEPSPFKRISFDLDETYIENLGTVWQRLAIDLNLTM
jgi:hypothetical protein